MSNRRMRLVLMLLLPLSACGNEVVDAIFVGSERDLAQRRTFIMVALKKSDHAAIEKSGEALLLNIYPCGGDKDKALPFPLQTREATAYGQDRVALRFVVSANTKIQDSVAEQCATLTTSGYSFDSFETAPFRLR